MMNIHSGLYRTDDGRYVPIRGVADMYDSRYVVYEKGRASSRRTLVIRGTKPENIENREIVRAMIRSPNYCDDHHYHETMKVLDVFAREAGARLDGTSK